MKNIKTIIKGALVIAFLLSVLWSSYSAFGYLILNYRFNWWGLIISMLFFVVVLATFFASISKTRVYEL